MDDLDSRMDGANETAIVFGNGPGADFLVFPEFRIEMDDVRGDENESDDSRNDDGRGLAGEEKERRNAYDGEFGQLFEKRGERIEPRPPAFIDNRESSRATEGFGVVVIHFQYRGKVAAMEVFPAFGFQIGQSGMADAPYENVVRYDGNREGVDQSFKIGDVAGKEEFGKFSQEKTERDASEREEHRVSENVQEKVFRLDGERFEKPADFGVHIRKVERIGLRFPRIRTDGRKKPEETGN